MTAPVAILFDRFGPYHVARIAAAAKLYPTVGIEFGRDTSHYAWDAVDSHSLFERFTIVPKGRAEDRPRLLFARELFQVLDRVRPRAVAIPGWYHFGSLLALAWSLRTGTPVVMMSESQASDEERRWWKERLKRKIVELCSAALVGGSRHVEYMEQLGMSGERIFRGYDAIDNDYFAAGADRARSCAATERTRLQLPTRFFVASSRFIHKKNLLVLLRSYAAYRRSCPEAPLKLVVLGDGPMRGELESLRASLDLTDDVLFPGFQQYGDIPSYYGLAEGFVHASTVEQWGLVVNEAAAAGLPLLVSRSCGCVPELVVDGESGYTFDPMDESALSGLLARLAADAGAREAMGKRAKLLVQEVSPRVFGEQLGQAVEYAQTGRARAGVSDWALVGALALR